MYKTTITTKEWLKINDLLLLLGDETSIRNYSSILLNGMGELIRHNWAHLFFHKPHQQLQDDHFSVGISEKTFSTYNSYYYKLDDIRKITFDQTSPIRSTQVMDYPRWENTEYFSDFLKPNSFYYLCGIDIHYPSQLIATLTFIREKNELDFCNRDLLILKKISPHFGIHLANFFGLKKYRVWSDNFSFTQRECDIVELLAHGSTNKYIAAELSISVNTVKKHLGNIFEKVGVNSKLQLISKISSL